MSVESLSANKRRILAYRAAQIEVLLLFRQRFPFAFARISTHLWQPLKVGIHLDIAAALPDLDIATIGKALGFYTRDRRYRFACTLKDIQRVDLDGKPVGPVSPEHVANARCLLEKQAARDKARNEQRKALRAKAALPPPPKRLSLTDLKVTAAARKLSSNGGMRG
jgi:sRNA-binding protein